MAEPETPAGSSMLDFFLEEAGELIDRLEGELDTDGGLAPDAPGVEVVERVLHTIKGNASALGYAEYAAVSTRVLEQVRKAARKRDGRWFRKVGPPLLRSFVRSSRDFLRRARDAGPGDALVPGSIAMRVDRAEEGASGPGASRNTGSDAGSDDWEGELRELLAGAPRVEPRIGEIVALARRELERERAGLGTGFCPDEEPGETARVPGPILEPLEIRDVDGGEDDADDAGGGAARDAETAGDDAASARDGGRPVPRPGAAGSRDGASRGDALQASGGPPGTAGAAADGGPGAPSVPAGLLVEAACLRARLPHGVAPPEVLELLETFAASGTDVHAVEGHPGLGPRTSSLAARCGERLRVEAGDVAWSMAGAELVATALDRAASALLPGADAAPPGDVLLRPSRAEPGRMRMEASGLPAPARTAERLRWLEEGRRIAGLGGTLRGGEGGEDVVLELPEPAGRMEVLRARTGSTEVAFPAHRVLEVRDGASFREERTPAGELETVDLSGGGEDAPVLVLGHGAGRRGVRVDEVLGRETLLVLPAEAAAGDEGLLGFCVRGSDLARIPLLSASAS